MDPPAPFHPTATRKPRFVRVGVAVLVMGPDDKIWAGTRQGSHGAGLLALPGGHLEMYESWEECAIREVKEETDLDVENACFCHFTNDPMREERKHYVTIFMVCQQANRKAEARLMEPDKCKGWNLYSYDELKRVPKDQLFGPLRRLLDDKTLQDILLALGQPG